LLNEKVGLRKKPKQNWTKTTNFTKNSYPTSEYINSSEITSHKLKIYPSFLTQDILMQHLVYFVLQNFFTQMTNASQLSIFSFKHHESQRWSIAKRAPLNKEV